MENEKSLLKCYSLQEAKENFSLDELFTLAKKKNLSEWLEMNLYTNEGKKISEAVNNQISDAELKFLICKIFDLSLENLSADEFEEISSYVAKNQHKELFFENHADGRKSAFVENQRELIQALKDGAEVLFLYGVEFRIPVEWYNRTYIGKNNSIIDFNFDGDIDLDERNIILEDVQIFLHNPITLKMDNSKNVKILNGTKKALGIHPTLKEIFEIMRGRSPFESARDFKRRAEDIRGIAVGKVLLEDKNYFYDEEIFKFQPQWDLEYISVVKNFLQDREFFINLSPQHAELLYTNERKQQIFADFTYIDGKLTILNLYFETVKLGRIAIKTSLQIKPEKISSGSGIGGLGYGLNIITAYENCEGWE
ncbi:MAG: hypothetical protein IK062_03020 [Selenomonadaceae bacterium]|nr:hypothetical protein [Selenomonadaceae bacterium]